MPPKPRQVKIEQKGALAAMSKLESRSDEELEAETRFRAAAQAILGARAAERMDAKRSREHFRQAIAASRPQERLQLRRMAEASLALAERRAGDLKVAAEKLGQAPPSRRQLFMLQFMGYIAPPPGSGIARRAGGILLLLAIIVALLALGWGVVQLDLAAVRRPRHRRLDLLGLPARRDRPRHDGRPRRRKQRRARDKAAEQRADLLGAKRR